MNRPLEFRAWHLPSKRLYYDIDFCPDFVTFRWDESKTDTENYKLVDHPLNREDCILMQFTGRVDELGHKVWEGDVVRFDNMWIGEIPEGDEEYSQYSYIGFHNGGFANFPVSEEVTEEDIKSLISFEIFYLTQYSETEHLPMQRMGCMYEHPELLELTKLYPLHPDAIRPNESDTTKTTNRVPGVACAN